MKKIIFPLFALLFLVIGCENPMQNKSNDIKISELQGLSSELISDLGLSRTSADAINNTLNKFGKNGKHREPGFLWRVAVEMSDKLTAEEKAVLFEKMDKNEILLFSKYEGKKNRKGKKIKRGGSRSIYKILDEDQKVLYKTIMFDYKEDFKSIRSQIKSGLLSKDAAKIKIEVLVEALKIEIDTLLSSDQKDQLEQQELINIAEKLAFRDSSKSVMVEVLNMSVDQVTAYDEANRAFKDLAANLKEQRKFGIIEKEALKESLKAVFSERSDRMLAIFSDSQLEIIKIHKALQFRMKKYKKRNENNRKKITVKS